MISTASGTTVTIGPEGCPSYYPTSCNDDRGKIFLSNESLTWIANSIFDIGIEKNLGLDVNGDTGFDTVTLGWQGSGGPTVNHSIVQTIKSASYWLGVFGVNPRPTNFTTYVDPQPSFMQQLVNFDMIPSLSYAYTAGNRYRFNEVYGSLVLGGYDTNRFQPNNITFPFFADISRDLLVNVHSITTDYGNTIDLLPGGTIPMYIDSTVSQIWVPQSACSAFEKAFNLTFDTDAGIYVVSSSERNTLRAANPNVTFTLGTQTSGGPTIDIVLPYGAFDLNSTFPTVVNQTFYFPLQCGANETQYILGRTFLQEAYLIADYDRQNFTVAQCLWDENKITSSNLMSIVRNNATSSDAEESSSGLTGGDIAGIVVGAVVGVLLIIAAVIFLILRRRRARAQKLAIAEKSDTTATSGPNGNTSSDTTVTSNNPQNPDPTNPNPINPSPTATSPGGASLLKISGPIGGELGSTEIHELNPSARTFPLEMAAPGDKPSDLNARGYAEMPNAANPYAAQDVAGASEMQGEGPGGGNVFEMHGSDVHELPAWTEQQQRGESKT